MAMPPAIQPRRMRRRMLSKATVEALDRLHQERLLRRPQQRSGRRKESLRFETVGPRIEPRRQPHRPRKTANTTTTADALQTFVGHAWQQRTPRLPTGPGWQLRR